jgi:NAD(P)-dependent dehydrogenase (short-subunit alcohol dehydrogenase family)
MRIELGGRTVALEGDRNPIVQAALGALVRDGGKLSSDPDRASILLLSWPLLPEAARAGHEHLFDIARRVAGRMALKEGGRILFLLSAIAGLPMRRHPDFSREMAAALTVMRTLAMEFAPKVLVNAVGFGVIETDAIVAGDTAQLTHASVGRTGTLEEAIAPVLFFCDPDNTYTTGQMLAVDGGWTAGYGRNF